MRFVVTLSLLIPFAAAALTIQGNVVDSDGKAVGSAHVWIVQPPDVERTQTNADGRFSAVKLRPGPFSIIVRKEGLAIGGIDGQAVGDGEVGIALAKPDALRLRVINHEYRPIEGARLRSIVVSDTFQVPIEMLAQHGFGSIRSDADGNIVVDDLPQGAWVRFSLGHPRYAEESIPYFPVGRKAQTIPMRPGVAIQGRVVTDDGVALAQARVAVFRVTASGPRATSEQWSDPEGYFTAVVEPGDYHVAATHREYVTNEPMPVLLERDETQVAVKLVLQRAHHVKGSVAFESGKPAGGVSVGYAVGGLLLETAITNANGEYDLKAGQSEGTIRVLPPDGYAVKEFSDVGVKELSGEVRLKPFVLFEIPSMLGKVVDSNGEPISNVVIASYAVEPPIITTCSDDGTFEIRLAKLPETQKASFFVESAQRFSRATFEVDLRGRASVDVKLEPYVPATSYENSKNVKNDMTGLAGKPAPAIACSAWANTEPLTSENLKGKVVALLLWGGFANDREGRLRIQEFNLLHDLYKDEKDIIIAGIHDAAVSEKDFERYVDEYKVRFAAGRDVDEAVTFDGFDTTYIPQVVLIDKKGILRFYDTDGRLLELIKVLRREAP